MHDDHFPPGAKDEDWLAQVGERGWIVLTKDRRIRYRHVEWLALMKAGVAAAGYLKTELTNILAAGKTFDGNRWNDLHYGRAFKQAARERRKGQ